jgi:hypothetical protein
MKVYLPSNGLCGLDILDLPQVKIDMLRDVPNLPEDDVNRKNSFLSLVVGDGDFLSKITPEDRDYLFVISAASISANSLPFTVKCKCGVVSHDTIDLGESEFVRLKKNQRRKVTKVIFGREYTFNYLSAKDEADIEDFAMDAPDDEFLDNKHDGVVAMTLFGDLSDESLLEARQVDLSVYFQALLFQRCYPHGISLKKQIVCQNPECGRVLNTHLPITGNILDVDVQSLLSNYVYLTKELSIEGFFSLSMQEYTTFVQALNAKLESSKR